MSEPRNAKDIARDAAVMAAIDVIHRARKLLEWVDRASLAKVLRIVLEKLEGYPTLENDLEVIENRLRGMLQSDPDKTPRVGLTNRGFPAPKKP